MSEFTPGPWTWLDDWDNSPFATAIVSANCLGHPIVATINTSEAKGQMEIGCGGNPEANARLIAAAPDLLEAAKETVAFYDEYLRTAIMGDEIPELRQAIAKAEGRDEE